MWRFRAGRGEHRIAVCSSGRTRADLFAEKTVIEDLARPPDAHCSRFAAAAFRSSADRLAHRSSTTPTMNRTSPRPLLAAGALRPASAVLGLAAAVVAFAQVTPAADPGATVKLDAFNVTGSNIKRLEAEKVLPVTLLDRDAIEASNSLTPVELLLRLPQLTDVPRNETSNGGANTRGDNANISLRGMGSGYTLILLNGRRLTPAPLVSNEAGIPAMSVNVNQLPVRGLARIEVLRDGASSIYGSDAIAGVVNFITDPSFRGTEVRTRFGAPEHGAGQSFQASLTHGMDFAKGRGRLLLVFDAFHRDPIFMSDRAFTATANHSAQAPAPFNVVGSAFDGRAADGQYPAFRIGTSTTANYFRPVNGVMTFTTVAPTRAANPEYFLDVNRFQNVAYNETERHNWTASASFDLNENITAFTDLSFYHATSRISRQPIRSAAPSSSQFAPISADNPYNPYGSRFYSPTGAPNADGTPRLVGTPQQLVLVTLSHLDVGAEDIGVTGNTFRAVAGLRGTIFQSWSWETAGLYSRAAASDISYNAGRESLFQQALMKTDASAYNPFGYTFKVQNGAVVPDQPYTNPASALSSWVQPWRHDGTTSLTSGDFRASGPLLTLWGNTVSLAVGGEGRREDYTDTRPPYAGVNPPGSGLDENDNDFLVATPKPDASGKRTVFSGYSEIVVPLAGAERNLPLVRSLELSGAARYEDYSDFGTTVRPKFGLNWKPFDSVMVRASLNRGFAAPTLTAKYTPTQFTVDSSPGTVDPYRNEGIGEGAYSQRRVISANPNLKPIKSNGRSLGVVIEVPGVRGLTVTGDYFQIEQQDEIGSRSNAQILNSDTALLKAYTAQQLAAGRTIDQIDLGSGTSAYKGDPAVVRLAVSAADIAAFNAANASKPAAQQLAAVGRVISRYAPFENFARSFVSGVDLGLSYTRRTSRWGRITASTEWTYLIRSDVTRSPAGGAQTVSDRLNVGGTTRWRGSSSLLWEKRKWSASLGAYYIGSFGDTAATTTAANYEALGRPDYLLKQVDNSAFVYRYRVEDVITFNASLGYDFGPERRLWLKNTKLKIGVTNLTDREPPLASDAMGFNPAVHGSLFPGRTWTFELSRKF